MTVPQTAAQARQEVEDQVAGPAAEFLERLAAALGARASVAAAFGQPVQSQGVTVIPVAKVGFGFGGGISKGGERGGGTGGASAAPFGYIEVKDGNAAFKPIRRPLTDLLLPVALLLAGSLAPTVVRRLLRPGRG